MGLGHVESVQESLERGNGDLGHPERDRGVAGLLAGSAAVRDDSHSTSPRCVGIVAPTRGGSARRWCRRNEERQIWAKTGRARNMSFFKTRTRARFLLI